MLVQNNMMKKMTYSVFGYGDQIRMMSYWLAFHWDSSTLQEQQMWKNLNQKCRHFLNSKGYFMVKSTVHAVIFHATICFTVIYYHVTVNYKDVIVHPDYAFPVEGNMTFSHSRMSPIP